MLLLVACGLVACGDPSVPAPGGDGGVMTDAEADDAGPVDAGAPDARSCPDEDGDGFGAAACGGGDCDDADPQRYPGNVETCDALGRDEDCDSTTVGPDVDGDGFAAPTCCNRQAGGALLCGSDCDDASPDVSPSAPEVCDGVDDDCDGAIDEGVSVLCYGDADGDGYALVGATSALRCASCLVGETTRDPATVADCDDTHATVHPGAPELCDALDNGCTGADASLEDSDGDHHTDVTYSGCSGGFPIDDCEDRDARVFPGQTAYFSLGYCPPSQIPMGISCWYLDVRFAPTLFDFDCDGTTEPQLPAMCVSSCFIDPGCGRSGPAVAAAFSDCGTPVSFVTCGECGTCQSGAVTTTEPLGCR